MIFLRTALALFLLIACALTYGVAMTACELTQQQIEDQATYQQQLDEEAVRLAEECERAFPRNQTQQQACKDGVL